MNVNEKPEKTVKFVKYRNYFYAVNCVFGNTGNMLSMIPGNKIGAKYNLINHLKQGKPIEITVRAMDNEEFKKWKIKNGKS